MCVRCTRRKDSRGQEEIRKSVQASGQEMEGQGADRENVHIVVCHSQVEQAFFGPGSILEMQG